MTCLIDLNSSINYTYHATQFQFMMFVGIVILRSKRTIWAISVAFLYMNKDDQIYHRRHWLQLVILLVAIHIMQQTLPGKDIR